MENKILNKKEGSALMEAIVAISVMTIGLIAIFSLLSRSLHSNKNVYERLIASSLASEGIEIIKNIIDTDVALKELWNRTVGVSTFDVYYEVEKITNRTNITTIPSMSSKHIKFSESNGFGYSGQDTLYKRTVVVKALSSDEILVRSIVEWLEDNSGTTKKVELVDKFTNWRKNL